MSNLAARILVAIVAIPLIVAACYFGGPYFFIFTTAIIVFAANEFYQIARTKNLSPSPVVGVVSAGMLNAIAYSRGLDATFDILLLAVAFVLLWELSRKRTDKVTGTFENAGATLTAIVYIGLFGSMLTAIRERLGLEHVLPNDRDAGLFIIAILATIWICDSAAYFVGSAVGRHKMSRLVSPNKSWEGGIAGFVFAVAAAVGAKYIAIPDLSLNVAVLTGIIVGFFGQAGDFVESMFKRDAGVKDSSNMIPGHGGILDRFDSLFFSAPLIYLMLKYLH